MKEEEIIHKAFDRLDKNVIVFLNWETKEQRNDMNIDGLLNFLVNDHKLKFNVEIKKDVKNHQLYNLIENKNHFKDFLLVAEKLYPKTKKELRENDINYLEANGNAYINQNNVYLFIDTNKPLKTRKEKGNRAFTKTGLKVVFHFLIDPQLINRTQREIADLTNVGLGNIPQVINGLWETDYLLKLNTKEYVINGYEELLDKWIAEFDQTLRPTLFKQRFRFQNRDLNWREIDLNTNKTLWGGEPAGDLLTNYLRPEEFTLYTTETNKDLMINYRLVPDEDGEIFVYEMFWNTKFNNKTVPKELVYADLMITNNQRCRETAKMIFDERIKPNI
ncbi:type IV toxin-antitoxin system AbiEi family antitoxin [Pseudozobellia sp. WGM2]|uniref:type IV toxin-antitoxin system AbiEi family antitoxin n=1 Tax=Pseudozobellia sp. WGM2 TaxID=2787625 RepID=UPI001ADF97C8|nr:type IV toxin-antitoxin system AbiEi family antitoxin [Pseudozobellia sp. WGM2]